MTFVADESVDGQIVERLRQDGHTVWAVHQHAVELTGAFAVLTPGALRIRRRL